LLPPMAKRILQYFDSIDQSDGKAHRMDLLRIAGNEANLNRMVAYLIAQKLVVESVDKDGRVTYSKTDLGENLHALLKGHEHFGSLLTDLGRSRLGPS
jgi:hypothetical protein